MRAEFFITRYETILSAVIGSRARLRERERPIDDRGAEAAAAAIRTRRDSRIDPGPELRAHSRWRLGYSSLPGSLPLAVPAAAAAPAIETTRTRLAYVSASVIRRLVPQSICSRVDTVGLLFTLDPLIR